VDIDSPAGRADAAAQDRLVVDNELPEPMHAGSCLSRARDCSPRVTRTRCILDRALAAETTECSLMGFPRGRIDEKDLENQMFVWHSLAESPPSFQRERAALHGSLISRSRLSADRILLATNCEIAAGLTFWRPYDCDEKAGQPIRPTRNKAPSSQRRWRCLRSGYAACPCERKCQGRCCVVRASTLLACASSCARRGNG
jgi:hypothetical protein